MNNKFFDLKQEKQDRIINAALKVFALNGYSHASTDDIVKEASISKGLLFHYFISKLGLYGFMFDYSSRFMMLEMSRQIDRSETDFLSLIKQMEKAKLLVMRNYPYIGLFLDRALREECPEALAETEVSGKEYQEKIKDFLDQADHSAYAAKADPEMVGKTVAYTIAGLREEYGKRQDTAPELLYQTICDYLSMFRKLLE